MFVVAPVIASNPHDLLVLADYEARGDVPQLLELLWVDAGDLSANAFGGVLLAVALLAVLLAALLTLTQIRHTHDRLARQFDILRALAEIDRAILARQDLDRIVETVLVRMRTLLPARHAGIAIFDRNGGPMMRAYRIDHAHAATPTLERLPATGVDVSGWLANSAELTLDPANADHPLVRMLVPHGAQVLIAFPIIAEAAVAGTLVLGLADPGSLGAASRHARDLCNRLGVAFATAAKDEELYYQAHYDPLTTLPNRLLFKDELARRMTHARREQRSVALLFIDLDNFKNVNDRAGHPAGDEVLRGTADRLRRCVRSGDALARLGGDEFTVVISDLASPRAPEVIARHILEAMSVPFTIGTSEYLLSASIGIAMHPADGATPEELLRNADTAMYRAKEAGRNRWIYFEERMNAAALMRVGIERDLRRALDADEFRLVYQPQFELASGRLVAAEALLRWHHPEAGVLLPDAFIARAEETGVIERLGLWVLNEACRQRQQWAAEGLRLERIALNVSAPQLRHKDFVEQIGACLRRHEMPASCLELEITESVLMEPGRHVEAAFELLDAMRVRIALDDFGTGYSSLAYLNRFPIHVVKIDRAYVADLDADASSIAVSGAIVGMAHALGKQVMAEGVETAAQAAILLRLGCDLVQGYHFGRPLAADDFAALARLVPAAGGTASTP